MGHLTIHIYLVLTFIGNLTALSIFVVAGNVSYFVAIFMGLGSFLGGKCGASLVMYKDEKWLRIIFLILMTTSTFMMFDKYYFCTVLDHRGLVPK